MEKNDTNIILQRIKTYFPKFYYTGYTVDNWYMEIRNYDPNTIIEALRLYAEDNIEPPSVINLKTIADRLNNQEILDYSTTCKICGRVLENKKLEIHEERCRSIRYMCKKYEEIYNKTLDKRLLWEISLNEFNQRYDDLLRVVLKQTNSLSEKFYLEKYFETMEEL